jgi:hypothetical protein
MKYFTKELWLGANSRNDSRYRETSDQWNANFTAYQAQLQTIQHRLDEAAYRFFIEENLHDGRVLSFTVGDAIHHETHGSALFDINLHNTTVEIKALSSQLDVQYTLRYSKLRRVQFDYPSETPLFHVEGAHIGDWGYDELTAADDDYLRHEVLFASGSTILIEFKDFSYEREPCEGSRYQSL